MECLVMSQQVHNAGTTVLLWPSLIYNTSQEPKVFFIIFSFSDLSDYYETYLSDWAQVMNIAAY